MLCINCSFIYLSIITNPLIFSVLLAFILIKIDKNPDNNTKIDNISCQ